MEKIFIRADGNSILGLGHIMRCCSVAEALEEKGAICCFLVADEDSAAIVRNRGFEVLQLNSMWNDLNQEIDGMINLIQREKIDLLLIDSYYVSDRYLKKMRQYTKTAYLTGMNTVLYPVDILINYHIYAKYLGYEKQYKQDTRLVLGCQFAPLQKDFSIEPMYRQDEKKIFITTGGTDPYGIILEVLKLLLESDCQKWEYHIILGKYYKEKEIKKLDNLRNKTRNLFFYKDVQNMAEIMRTCSIAISAAGSTLYELCACGIPTVAFAFADNQLLPLKAFSQQNFVESAGDIRQNFSENLKKIVDGVLQYAMNKELCIERSNKNRRNIDGKGAKRLAEILIYESSRI